MWCGQICRSFSRVPPRRRLTTIGAAAARRSTAKGDRCSRYSSRTVLFEYANILVKGFDPEAAVQEQALVSNAAIEVISPAPRVRWGEAVAADDSALLSHTPEWLDIICAVDGWTDASRLYVWPSGRHVVLPMVRKVFGGVAAVEECLPRGWGFGGLIASGGATPEDTVAVVRDLSRRRLLRQHVCPSPLQGHSWQQAIGPAAAAPTVTRRAHAVNLSCGVANAWRALSENARRGVRKAERQGIEIEYDGTGRLFDVFEELWLDSVKRWARQGGYPAWVSRWRERRLNPRSRWRQIARRTEGGVAIWVARHRGEPAAAIVVLRGRNDHYTRGAMNKQIAGPTRANFLLHWLAIQDACSRAAQWYQMGQSGRDGCPVARFKENFGAKAYDFPEVQMERVPIAAAASNARTILRRVIGKNEQRPISTPP
jgi:hypothetical protein